MVWFAFFSFSSLSLAPSVRATLFELKKCFAVVANCNPNVSALLKDLVMFHSAIDSFFDFYYSKQLDIMIMVMIIILNVCKLCYRCCCD